MEEFHKKILIVIVIVGVLTVMSPGGLNLTGGVIDKEAFMNEGYGCKIQSSYGRPCSSIGDGTWVSHPKNPGWCMQCPYENYKTSE